MKNFFLFLLLITTQFSIAQSVSPVLEFPQPGLDDFSAYSGYKTRFYRDAEDNTVQISFYKDIGRVVNLWADAANESISFSIKDVSGKPVDVLWNSDNAFNSTNGKNRYLQYSLLTYSSNINIGLFLLGSMRIERDFRYNNRYNLPLNTDTVFVRTELLNLIGNIEKLPEQERSKQLEILNAKSVENLRNRLSPQMNYYSIKSQKAAIINKEYFDGKNHLSLEIMVKDRSTSISILQNMIHVNNKSGNPVVLYIKIGTDSPPLTPLSAQDIFNKQFLDYYEKAKSGSFYLMAKSNLNRAENDSIMNFKRLDRQIKSLELLASKEKLMAGLPNFATYFGRDMMMSTLMMEPIWKSTMLENVIKSVLRKLRSDGNVSHEEGLEGEAIRENAADYNSILEKYFSTGGQQGKDSLIITAEKILENLNKTTENYRMIDDDFQLPVLAAHYLSHKEITNSQKISFLKSKVSKKDSTVLSLILENLIYITNKSSKYIADPEALDLISFEKVDGFWQSASWRDSRAGYAGGRFPMDVNVIWVPQALESVNKILDFLKNNNFSADDLLKMNSNVKGSLIEEFFKSPDSLTNAVKIWKGTGKYFWTDISPNEVKKKIEEKLDWLGPEDSSYWKFITQSKWKKDEDIKFLTLSLDENGNRIKIENTDPATSIFLNDYTEEILKGKIRPDSVINLIKVFTIPYPAGLFIDSLGPLVANDTYASRDIWEIFKNDRYHSPYVVWGREVNLILLGVSKQILAAYDSKGNLKDQKLGDYVAELKSILNQINSAVEESGLKYNELWTYQIINGRLFPKRYETTSDIQLWNTTNLSAEYLMSKIFHNN
jgi:hypothetical protein